MRSEDIAAYVAGLEEEVERLSAERDSAQSLFQAVDAEVDRLRAESRDMVRQLHEVTVRAENAEQDARDARSTQALVFDESQRAPEDRCKVCWPPPKEQS